MKQHKAPSTKLRVGDLVVVLMGKDKGKTGKITAIYKAASQVEVEGINIVKKHVKANPQRGIEGGIVDKIKPVHISNVALLNPSTQKASRIGYKIAADGAKQRFFKTTNTVVEEKKV